MKNVYCFFIKVTVGLGANANNNIHVNASANANVYANVLSNVNVCVNKALRSFSYTYFLNTIVLHFARRASF